jgi:hypothetical protein
MMMLRSWPIAASAVKPKMRSAAGFYTRITPSLPAKIMASGAC